MADNFDELPEEPVVAATESKEAEPALESQRGISGPLALSLPTESRVWQEARRLVTDKNTRVEDLAVCASQDPVMVIELLRVANAMYFASGRSPITSVKTSIVRLGSDTVLDTLEKLRERPDLDDEDVQHWLESHRGRCKRIAIVAKLLAEALSRALSDDCEAAGAMVGVGEMLAVAHLKGEYVKLAEEHSRGGINYRLAQDYKFDVDKMCIAYLRRNGIPEALLFAIDRDGRSRTAERAIMKPICMAAIELVDAFDANRWEKLAPGKKIPPKSAIRMLQISDAQYLRVYERASEFLFSARLLEEKKKRESILEESAAALDEANADNSEFGDENALESEIESILSESSASEVQLSEWQEERPQEKSAPLAPVLPTRIQTVPESMASVRESFSLTPKPASEKRVPRVQKTVEKPRPPAMSSASGNKVLNSISTMFDQADSSEALLTSLLDMLVADGVFEKSALIVVSRDRKQALVVAARGPNLGNGQKIVIEDPLSPLAQCFAKVQSFGSKENKVSPFGSKSFAVSPIDVDHDTPVALYADCGNEGTISFEARRIFRNVVNILNEKLPSLPGGLPVEL